MSTLLWLPLAEPDGVMPSDRARNVADLAPDAATTAPLAGEAWTGQGRAFAAASSQALWAVDLDGGNSLTTRDATVQAIVALTKFGMGPWTIYARGTHDGSPEEPTSLGLRLTDAGGGLVGVSLFWGASEVAGPVTYEHPGDDEFILLTATRRWVSVTEVVCRFYVADDLIGEVISTAGNIGGGASGHTMVGGRKLAASWGDFFSGTIDELMVTDHEMSHDEVRHTWRRLTEYQLAGERMFEGLAPPGARMAGDPSSNFGKLARIAGQGLGLALATTEGMRELFLADRCDADDLARWEALINARTTFDSLGVRRARVLGHLSRENGYHGEAVRLATSPPLDLDAADLRLLEFTNTLAETWDVLEPERWLVDNDDGSAWTVASNQLLGTTTTSALLSYDVSRGRVGVRMASYSGDVPTRITGSVESATLATNTLAGIWLWSGTSGDAAWFGLKSNGVGADLVLVSMLLDEVTSTVVATSIAAPVQLRVRRTAMYHADFEYSTDGGTTWLLADNRAVRERLWFGYGFMAMPGTTPAGGLAAAFGPLSMHDANGLRPFAWYVYRDAMLGGNPDTAGAQAVVRRIRPAHTFGGVTESSSVLCDDARYGLCDRGPLGAVEYTDINSGGSGGSFAGVAAFAASGTSGLAASGAFAGAASFAGVGVAASPASGSFAGAASFAGVGSTSGVDEGFITDVVIGTTDEGLITDLLYATSDEGTPLS